MNFKKGKESSQFVTNSLLGNLVNRRKAYGMVGNNCFYCSYLVKQNKKKKKESCTLKLKIRMKYFGGHQQLSVHCFIKWFKTLKMWNMLDVEKNLQIFKTLGLTCFRNHWIVFLCVFIAWSDITVVNISWNKTPKLKRSFSEFCCCYWEEGLCRLLSMRLCHKHQAVFHESLQRVGELKKLPINLG